MARRKDINLLRRKNQTHCKCGKQLNSYNKYALCHACLAVSIRNDNNLCRK